MITVATPSVWLFSDDGIRYNVRNSCCKFHSDVLHRLSVMSNHCSTGELETCYRLPSVRYYTDCQKVLNKFWNITLDGRFIRLLPCIMTIVIVAALSLRLFSDDGVTYKVRNSCDMFRFEPSTCNKSDEHYTVPTCSVQNTATEKYITKQLIVVRLLKNSPIFMKSEDLSPFSWKPTIRTFPWATLIHPI
jgi:hypothetical protein